MVNLFPKGIKMGLFKKGDRHLTLNFDIEGLTEAQIRMIKNVNSLLMDVLTTNDEDHFFEGSADFMRSCAAVIHECKFSRSNQGKSSIPYGEQAVEYSMDILQEFIATSKLSQYDN